MRLRSSPDVHSRTEEKGKSRRSIANISTVIALQLSGLLSVGAVNIVTPVKQPSAYARNVYGPNNPHYIPDPDMDVEHIIASLPTPESVGRFYLHPNIENHLKSFRTTDGKGVVIITLSLHANGALHMVIQCTLYPCGHKGGIKSFMSRIINLQYYA